MYQEKKHKQKHLLSRIQRYIPEAYSHPFVGDNMRIGIIFPVVIFITAVYF